MGDFEIPKFEVPKFYEGNKTAQKNAVANALKDKEKKSASKTFESASTKGAKVSSPVSQREKDALWDEFLEYKDEKTESINFPAPNNWNETLDTNDDGKVDSKEIQVAKEVLKEKKVKEVIIAKEEMDIVHEEDVKSDQIETDGSSIVFRDNNEKTKDKKINNTNPDKKNGDFVMVLDGSENAKETITTFGTDFFYTSVYSNLQNNQDDSFEKTQEKLVELKTINYSGMDTIEERLKEVTPAQKEKLDYLLELYLIQNKMDKENLTPYTLREIKVKLLKEETKAI